MIIHIYTGPNLTFKFDIIPCDMQVTLTIPDFSKDDIIKHQALIDITLRNIAESICEYQSYDITIKVYNITLATRYCEIYFNAITNYGFDKEIVLVIENLVLTNNIENKQENQINNVANEIVSLIQTKNIKYPNFNSDSVKNIRKCDNFIRNNVSDEFSDDDISEIRKLLSKVLI